MALKVLVEPVIEPVTLLEAKAWLRLDHGQEDALVSQLISTSRIRSETITKRAMNTQTLQECVLARPDTGVIEATILPVQAILEIAELHLDGTEQVLDAGSYIPDLDNGRVILGKSGKHSRYRIKYIAGYGDSISDVPSPLKTAILLQVGWLFEHRDEDGGAIPHAAQVLLSSYTRVQL